MRKLTKQQKEEIIKKIQENKPISDEYRFLIPFETEREYELTYAGKERKEDILAETMRVPLQPVKTFCNGVKVNDGWTNKLIFGDNLQVLKEIYTDQRGENILGTKNKIKLIYIDPPFATKQEFRGSQDQKAYQDKIAGAKFLEFLRKRLIFLHKILADDGSIYVHLDYRKVHYIKTLMDEIFGENRLVNEIIWHYNRWTAQSKAYQHMHDTILWYSKTDNYIYNMQYKEYAEGSKRAHEERGYIQRGSYISKPNPKGVVADDVWNINFPGPSAERTGFPTQKPEVLLERIIKASSNSGDIVFDAFAGSGTTGAVAEKLGRRWIMIDSSKLAIYTMQKRFLNLRKEIGDRGLKLTPKPFTLYNAGLYDYQKIKELPWEQYRDFALKLFQCRDGKHRISGIDLDGYLGPYDVLVFNYQKYKNITLDYGFIDDLHKSLGNKIGKWFFIITPAANVQFLEDYVERGGIKYFILRIPYSIISEIHQKGFLAIKQPVSVYDVNDVMEAVGFDFIQVPKVGCQYYLAKSKGAGPLKLGKGKIEVIIKIKTFKSETLSQEAQDLKNLESLSMVMIDYNYNGKIFDLDEVFYAEDLRNQNYEIRFDFNEIKGQMMLIYCDIFGNEKREIKTLKDFKK